MQLSRRLRLGVKREARLPATNKRHDFELVTRFEDALGVTGSRDEFEVAFDGQVPRFHLQQREQLRDGAPVRNLSRFVVDDDFHCRRFPQSDAKSPR